MNRETALEAIRAYIKNENLVAHMVATEAVMRFLAGRLREDEEEWALAGLLHDIDVELSGDDPRVHSRMGAEMAKTLGASPLICQAILCHNEAHGVGRESLLDKALFCADPLTGLITAAALVRPDKKLSGVTVDSVRKRFKEKRFAAGVNREQIAACSEVGLGLEEFIGLGLAAMQDVAGELKL